MGDRRTESPLIPLGRLWVAENYPYNSTHLLKSLDWLDRLAPDASDAVRLATLTHDMERAFGGPDAIAIKLNDRAYEEAHSNRSANIVGAWLRANGAQEDLTDGVEALIRVHEWGGSPDANLVQAADSLSFLETNIDLMLGFARTGKYPNAEVALKIDAMYERIQLPAARELARPMWELAKLRLMGSDPRVRTGVRPLYLRPESLDALLSLLREHGPGARLLAGGTDLLVRLRKGFEWPTVIVDVKRVAELRSDVVEIDGCIRIGARTVMTDVIEDRRIRQHFPALVDAAPVLLAHRASLNLVSSGGTRQMALDDFFTGPGRTVLAPGELVASIDLPLPVSRTGGAFGRLTRRHGVDLAIVCVCCVVGESGEARFAFGAVGPRPFVVTSRLDAPLDDVWTHARPVSDVRANADYRLAMLPVLTRRALREAVGRMREASEGA